MKWSITQVCSTPQNNMRYEVTLLFFPQREGDLAWNNPFFTVANNLFLHPLSYKNLPCLQLLRASLCLLAWWEAARSMNCSLKSHLGLQIYSVEFGIWADYFIVYNTLNCFFSGFKLYISWKELSQKIESYCMYHLILQWDSFMQVYLVLINEFPLLHSILSYKAKHLFSILSIMDVLPFPGWVIMNNTFINICVNMCKSLLEQL